jgi:hypothetical protein
MSGFLGNGLHTMIEHPGLKESRITGAVNMRREMVDLRETTRECDAGRRPEKVGAETAIADLSPPVALEACRRWVFHPGFGNEFSRKRTQRSQKQRLMGFLSKDLTHLPDGAARFSESLSMCSLRSFAANHFPF